MLRQPGRKILHKAKMMARKLCEIQLENNFIFNGMMPETIAVAITILARVICKIDDSSHSKLYLE